MRFFNLLVLAMTVALVACGGRRESKDDTSTFQAERVALEDVAGNTMDKNQPWATRLIQPRFKVCIHDNVSLESIKNTRFAVSDGLTSKDVLSDEAGCIRWTEVHPIQLAQNQTHIQFRRWIQGRSVFKGSVAVDLVWNPWGGKDNFYDLRYDGLDRRLLNLSKIQKEESFGFDSEIKSAAAPSVPFDGFQSTDVVSDDGLELLLNSMALRFIGLDKTKSEIDSLLTLKTVQRFEVSLEPKVVQLNLEKVPEVQRFSAGSMSLQIFLVREDASLKELKASDVVGHFTGDVEVAPQGTITQEVLLRIDDVAASQSRNRILVVLRPRGAEYGMFNPGVFSGHVNPLNDSFLGMGLTPVSSERPELLRRLRGILADFEAPQKAVDLFAGEKSAVRDETGVLPKLSAMTGTAGKKAWIVFCDKVFGPDQTVEKSGFFSTRNVSAREECKSAPKTYMKISRREFVDEVKGAPRYIGGSSPRKLKISRTLTYSRSQSDKMGTKNSANGGLSLGLDISKWGIGAKVGIGKEWYYTQTTDRTATQEVEAEAEDIEDLRVVSDTYEIDVAVQGCWVLSGTVPGSGSVYACESGTRDKTTRETYYVIRRNLTDTPFTDDDDGGNSWRLMIRGNATYQAFEKMLTSENTVLHFSKLITSPDLRSSLLPAFQVTQSYPGLLEESK